MEALLTAVCCYFKEGGEYLLVAGRAKAFSIYHLSFLICHLMAPVLEPWLRVAKQPKPSKTMKNER
jgi:hypothetical protein